MKSLSPVIVERTFQPTARKNEGNTSLVGKTAREVFNDCYQSVTAGRGEGRAKTGETFLNAVTPRLFVVDPSTGELHRSSLYGNIDNRADSVPVKFAEEISMNFFNKKKLVTKDPVQYGFKLFDSATNELLATDMPVTEYEDKEPSFLDAVDDDYGNLSSQLEREVDPSVCAWFYVYIICADGSIYRLCRQGVAANLAGKVRRIASLQGKTHMQVSMVLQDKVQNWYDDVVAKSTVVEVPAEVEDEAELADFSKI